jgi:hypothetical protein
MTVNKDVVSIEGGADSLTARIPLRFEGWIAQITFVSQQGAWVVERITVEPDDELPVGGITKRLLTRLPLAQAFDDLPERVGERIREIERFVYLDELRRTPRPGRRGRESLFYADVAAAYTEACRRGSHHPVRDLAEVGPYDEEQLRNALKKARQRGLLTDPPPGRAGGELTRRAFALLAAARPETSEKETKP